MVYYILLYSECTHRAKPVPSIKSENQKTTNRWQTKHPPKIKEMKRMKKKSLSRNNKFKFKCIKVWNLISINVPSREITTRSRCISNELIRVSGMFQDSKTALQERKKQKHISSLFLITAASDSQPHHNSPTFISQWIGRGQWNVWLYTCDNTGNFIFQLGRVLFTRAKHWSYNIQQIITHITRKKEKRELNIKI